MIFFSLILEWFFKGLKIVLEYKKNDRLHKRQTKNTKRSIKNIWKIFSIFSTQNIIIPFKEYMSYEVAFGRKVSTSTILGLNSCVIDEEDLNNYIEKMINNYANLTLHKHNYSNFFYICD